MNYRNPNRRITYSRVIQKDFMAEFALLKTGYHGGQFEGNECYVILNNLDRLRDYVPNHLAPAGVHRYSGGIS